MNRTLRSLLVVMSAVLMPETIVVQALSLIRQGTYQRSRSPLMFFRHATPNLSSSARQKIPLAFRLYSSSGEGTGESLYFSPKSTIDEENDPWKEYRNKNNRRDQVFSALSGDGGIKVTVCTARNLMNELMMQHTMTEIPTDALGRTIISALLMANGIQDEQVVQITINSDGPLRGVVGIANGKGEVRGYVGTPMLAGGDTELTLQEAVGKGRVQIVKNHPSWPRPYNGITAIRYGDLDRDIGIYLAESEQRSCALAAATSVKGVLCTSAGGYLIEQLPGVESEVVEQVERNLQKLVEMDGGTTLPTNLLLNGVTPLEIADIVLDGLQMKPLQQLEPKAVCTCNAGRLLRALRLLSREEVEEILVKQEEISARCDFCGKTYRMTPKEVRDQLDNYTGDPSRDDPDVLQ